MSKLSETLKDCMVEAGYTATVLAEKTGILTTNISEYLSGKHQPNLENFVLLLYAFNCSADYLLGLKELHGDEPLHTVPPFGERLRKILRQRKIPQTRLCKATGISTAAMYYWLNGQRSPSLESLVRIARYLECSVDYLIGRVD
jgi:transcriptional regulator with XRE-family HTH domain